MGVGRVHSLYGVELVVSRVIILLLDCIKGYAENGGVFILYW